VKAGNLLLSDEKKVMDLKIADYIDSNIKISKDMDYQDALILAMSKEKKAFKMYTDLASKTDNVEIKKLLLGIAQEEAKHKLRFELEYDQMVLTDN
jgi:rubrerythrin